MSFSLSGYEAPRTKVQVNPGCDAGEEQFVALRGLSARDIMQLINDYESIMQWLVSGVKFQNNGELINSLFIKSFDFCALCIAIAADEPQHANKVAFMPASVQAECAFAVLNATAPEGLKKSLGKMQKLLLPLLAELNLSDEKSSQVQKLLKRANQ